MKSFPCILSLYRFSRLLPALYIVCCISLVTNAQNLVPNGSFEEGITCPIFTGNLTSECANWYASLIYTDGIETTPEWFHECSDESLLTPPDVAFGTQVPFDGGGYAGLAAFSLIHENVRELIAVKLSDPLTVGSAYLVEFEVSNFYFPDYVVASNRLGFNFSTHPYFSYDSSVFPLNNSHYSESEIIPITGDWQTISQIIVADSAYQYIHIGNFYDDDNTDFSFSPNSSSPQLSYYAIDNVSVTGALNSTASEKSKFKVKVFPNPAFKNLNIALPVGQHFTEIRIYDSMGNQVIWKKDFHHKSQTSISVTDLNRGVYHLQILTDKTIYYEAFVKV